MKEYPEYTAQKQYLEADVRPISKRVDILSDGRNDSLPNLIPANMELSDDQNEKLFVRAKGNSPSLP